MPPLPGLIIFSGMISVTFFGSFLLYVFLSIFVYNMLLTCTNITTKSLMFLVEKLEIIGLLILDNVLFICIN